MRTNPINEKKTPIPFSVVADVNRPNRKRTSPSVRTARNAARVRAPKYPRQVGFRICVIAADLKPKADCDKRRALAQRSPLQRVDERLDCRRQRL